MLALHCAVLDLRWLTSRSIINTYWSDCGRKFGNYRNMIKERLPSRNSTCLAWARNGTSVIHISGSHCMGLNVPSRVLSRWGPRYGHTAARLRASSPQAAVWILQSAPHSSPRAEVVLPLVFDEGSGAPRD